ncbi:MAG: cyanophycin synthetase [Candidatus Paceibacterota bacterium]|jgi:D-alanine-D-alanine ligase-like ATP-grasp enzyme
MKRTKSTPFLGALLKKIAPRIGAKVSVEPVWGYVGQISYKNGRKRYFRGSTLDLNPVGASDIAKDKDYANFFMKRMGYPTITGKAFCSPSWAKAIGSKASIEAAVAYAHKLGFPLVAKPNSGSQGSGVTVVHGEAELRAALRHIFKRDRIALVQKLVRGKDYRVVVLDGRIISAYERVPLSVVGDGKTNLLGLLRKKQRDFIEEGRDTHIRMSDPRIAAKLARSGLSLRSVVLKGERVFLLDNANLSTGGDSIDVTDAVHPKFAELSITLTRDMGLRICGVDLMIDGDITEAPKARKHWILEINAAPGLDHYAKSGKAQEKIVEDLYVEVMRSLEN